MSDVDLIINELDTIKAERVIVHELSKPIKAHGEELTRLELREPTAKEVREIGLITDLSGRNKTSLNMEVVADYIVSLAGIPKSSVDQLSAKDFQNIGIKLLIFFA
jgi:hypothetical protein